MFKKLMDKQRKHNEKAKLKLEERKARIEVTREKGLNKINEKFNKTNEKLEAFRISNQEKINASPAKDRVENYKSKKQVIKEKIDVNKQNGIPCCFKCGSTYITAQKKGFGVGKALIGAVAVGPLGVAAGGINKNKIKLTCLNCGNQFKVK